MDRIDVGNAVSNRPTFQQIAAAGFGPSDVYITAALSDFPPM